jgi:Mor family transcriptional regulator
MFETEDLQAIGEQLDRSGRWPAQLAEITDFLEDELARALPDLAPAEARCTACRQTIRFITEFGGTRPYIAKPDLFQRAFRDLKIWSEHDGTVDGPNGIRALAAKYNLSEVAVWRVLKQQRELHRQPFEDD